MNKKGIQSQVIAQLNKYWNGNNSICDCCKVIIGNSGYTTMNIHDTQLYVCEDCLTLQEGK